MTDKNGVSEREHLEEVERQIGQTPIELQGPEFPELMEFVWSAFLSLNAARGQGYSGPMPISFSEISAWKELTGNQLSTWEVEAIKKIDSLYVRIINDRPN